jgi:cytochrome b561
MKLANTDTTWGTPAKIFHWLVAAAVLVLLGHGWWMTHMTPRPERIANYAWHAALGYDVLALMVLRLLWRLSQPVPALPADSKPWERLAAALGHWLLYGLLIASSLVGWALAGTMRTPLRLDLFGVPFPQIYGSGGSVSHGQLESTHRMLAYALAALVVVHVAGALRHHFIKRNSVMRRMLWQSQAEPSSLGYAEQGGRK